MKNSTVANLPAVDSSPN